MIYKNNQIPLYVQVKEDIIEKINNGTYKEGNKIPAEDELCLLYDISRPTLRQAIKGLVNDGKLIIKRGKGTYVAEPRFESFLIDRFVSFASELKDKNILFRDKIIEFKVIKPSQEITEILNLDPNDKVIHYNRVRYIKNEPFYNTKAYIPEKICPDFMNDKIENQSVFSILKGKYKLDFYKTKRYLVPAIATLEESKLLHIGPRMPIHYLETFIYDHKLNPIGYFKDYFRGDMCRFTFEIK